MLEGNRELGFILFSRTCKFIHLPLKERGHIYTWLRDIVKYFFFFKLGNHQKAGALYVKKLSKGRLLEPHTGGYSSLS